MADGGTLLLDEIGEMPLDLQVRILRLIQEREIEKIGATSPIKVDVRIIAATHRNLQTMVKQVPFVRISIIGSWRCRFNCRPCAAGLGTSSNWRSTS